MRIVMRRVLWTLVPIGSLGLLGWVPPLRIAFRRKTPAAWLWFAGAVGGTVLVVVLASTVREAPGVKDDPPAWVGVIEILNIISTAVYTGIATKVLTPKPRSAPPPPQVQDAYSYGYGPGYGYGYGQHPGQSATYLPSPPAVAAPTYPPVPPVTAAPAYPPVAPVTAAPAYPTVAPVAPVAPVVVPPVYPPMSPAVAPNAVDAAAAEVQAELRELRDLLGESAGGRTGKGLAGRDGRGQW